jgi:hypothetical protein
MIFDESLAQEPNCSQLDLAPTPLADWYGAPYNSTAESTGLRRMRWASMPASALSPSALVAAIDSCRCQRNST